MADTYIHRAFHDAINATGNLAFSGQPSDGDEVVIGSRTYTFKTVLSDVDGYVLIDGTLADTITNLTHAIIGGAGAGTKYAASTSPHADVFALGHAADMDVAALVAGEAGNLIATTETGANTAWGAATLEGGLDPGYVFWTATMWDPGGSQYAGYPAFGLLSDVVISLFVPDTAGGSGGTPAVEDFEIVDAFDDTHALANTPLPNTLLVFLNGVRLRAGAGNDYTLAGGTITLLVPIDSGWVLGTAYEF